MKITRIVSTPDGGSRFVDEVIPLRDAGAIGTLSRPISCSHAVFRRTEPDYDYDWHVAPARQFIVLLDGRIEIETTDGQVRRFGGGDVLLVEDTSGRGHRTRTIDGAARRSIFIVLADDAGSVGGQASQPM